MRRLSICLTLLLAACGGSSPAAPVPPTPTPTAVSLASVTVSPTAVAGGAAAVGTVTLTAAAPSNGTSVTLTSSHAAVRVSSVVVVPAGAASATFAVTTETVSSDTDATITGSLDGVTKTANLRITGAPAGSGPLLGLSTAIDDVVSGESTTGTITAVSPAPAVGIRVDLASSDSDVTVPAFVVIAAGATSATFDIRTSVVSAEKDVRLTATVGASLQPSASQVVAIIKLRVPRPRIDSVSPANGLPGTTVNITLTGALFLPGATVSVSGSGVSISGVVVDSSSSIRATLTISSSAALGERQISVATAAGSGSIAFMVGSSGPLPPPPTITSVFPAEIRRATSGGMGISGTNFTPGSTVAVSGSGVTISSVSYSSPTSLAISYSAAQDAPLGTRTLTVTSAGGTSAGYSLPVLQFPSITSMSPRSGLLGTTVDVTLGGRDFIAPVTPELFGCTGTTVSSLTHVSETQVILRLTIAANAYVGLCSIGLTSGGRSTSATFEIIPPPPTITEVTPNPYTGTGTVDLVILGTNLYWPLTVSVTGGGVTVQSAIVVNTGRVNARVVLAPDFASGDRFIVISTSGGNSNAFKWTVNRPSLSGGQ